MQISATDIEKPDPEYLESIFQELKEGRGSREFRCDYYTGILKILMLDPLRYRAFGPYWWVFKSDFYNAGISNPFGEEVDKKWVKLIGYKNAGHSITAAYLYEGERVKSNMYGSEHQIQLINGETLDFVSSDPYMEAFAIIKKGMRPALHV